VLKKKEEKKAPRNSADYPRGEKEVGSHQNSTKSSGKRGERHAVINAIPAGEREERSSRGPEVTPPEGEGQRLLVYENAEGGRSHQRGASGVLER